MTDTCADCGREFEALGRHLWQTECSYPKISDHKLEALTGMLMGDASLYRQANLPYFQVKMINREFLQYLDGNFSKLGRGVVFHRSAKETERQLAELSPNTNAENCSDIYGWRTMAHPRFNNFRSWYSSGEKKFPNLDLTPTILKYWYISDGTSNAGCGNYIEISAYNERNNPTKLLDLFDSTPIQPTDITKRGKVRFNKETSIDMLDWIGKPLPGFEYKWDV